MLVRKRSYNYKTHREELELKSGRKVSLHYMVSTWINLCNYNDIDEETFLKLSCVQHGHDYIITFDDTTLEIEYDYGDEAYYLWKRPQDYVMFSSNNEIDVVNAAIVFIWGKVV